MIEVISKIPARIKNAAVGGHVCGVEDIIDDTKNKTQQQINTEIEQNLGAGGSVDERIAQTKNEIIGGASSEGNTLRKLESRISPIEQAVGDGGSIDNRINSAKSEIIGNAGSNYNDLGKIETNIQNLSSNVDSKLNTQDDKIDLLNGSDVIVVADHTQVSSPDPQKIYREYGSNSYTDWMNQGSWQAIATYSYPGVDNKPTAGSEKLVKSGSVFAEYSTFDTEDATEFVKVSPYIRNVFIVPKTQSAFNTLKTVSIHIIYIGVNHQGFGEPFAIQITDGTGSKQCNLYYTPDLSKTLIYKLEESYVDSDFMRDLDVYVEFVANIDLTTDYFETVRNNGANVKTLDNTFLSLFKEMINTDYEPTFGSNKFAKSGGIYNMFSTFSSNNPVELTKVTKYLKNIYLIPRTKEDSITINSISNLHIVYIGASRETWNNNPFGVQISGTLNNENVYANAALSYIPDLTKTTIFKLDYVQANNFALRDLNIYVDFNINADFTTQVLETVNSLVSVRIDTTFTSLFKNCVKPEYDYSFLITSSGDGDFINLRTCIDYINTLPNYPKVTIKLGLGQHNMRSWYTNEEWNAVGFKGLVIPRNVSIIGIGRKRSDVLITCTSEISLEKASVLHLTDNHTIKNITVYANNMRYAVHDDESDYDFANANGSYRDIENCDFIVEDAVYNCVYGAGTKGGADWHFKNCRFINKGTNDYDGGCFSVHDRYDPSGETQSYKDERYIFEDCEFIGHHKYDIRLCPANSGVEETIILQRCKFKKVYVTSGYTGWSGSTTIFNVLGSANSKNILWGFREDARPVEGADIYNERKTIPKFSDTVISGINTDSSAIALGDYCKYDEEYGIIKGTQADNIGIALLGANVNDVVYVSKDYEFTYIGV